MYEIRIKNNYLRGPNLLKKYSKISLFYPEIGLNGELDFLSHRFKTIYLLQ